MSRSEQLQRKKTLPVNEDAETLAAIEEVLTDAKAGRTVSLEEVRKRLRKWVSESRCL
jgi:predicted transcriptional regulator